MTNRLRNRLWVGLALAMLVLFCAGGWLRNPPPLVLGLDTNLPATLEVPIGTEVTCHIRLATSWRQRPAGALRLDLPEGISLAPGAQVRLQTLSWGTAHWHLLLRLRPWRPGSVTGAALHLRCGKGSRATEVDLDLPAFTVTLPPTESEGLETAPLPSPEPRASGLAWLVIAAAVALLWFWRRRGRRPNLAPAAVESAPPSLLARLEALEARLDQPDAALFTALGDLVAESLQASCGVPATCLTLREQATWLGQSQALNATLAERLMRFWRSAEAVRFAGESASREAAGEAFAAARELIARDRGGRL